MLRKSALDMIGDAAQERSKSRSSLKQQHHMLFEGRYEAPGRVEPSQEHEEPRNFKRWMKKSMRGGFYFNPKLDRLVSNSYALELREKASVYFTIEGYKTPLNTSNYYLFTLKGNISNRTSTSIA
jgi:hypothetical protein